jgi:hypothetical protein
VERPVATRRRNRGSLTIWLTPDAIAGWKAEPRTTPGGQRHYSDIAIETALTCGEIVAFDLTDKDVDDCPCRKSNPNVLMV